MSHDKGCKESIGSYIFLVSRDDPCIVTNIVYIVFIVFNPFKSEFTIVIFIHYKPRIAVAILDL